MANQDDAVKPQQSHIAELENVRVHVTGEDRLRVEFKVNDLVRKLMPVGEVAGSCGGCNGCSGCSM